MSRSLVSGVGGGIDVVQCVSREDSTFLENKKKVLVLAVVVTAALVQSHQALPDWRGQNLRRGKGPSVHVCSLRAYLV